jgi:2-polyprenyl-3-methyl-5-hydroxy-6-metoxy-1,4-benzoquinol methylase
MACSDHVLGIDIDQEAIMWLKQQGIENITYFDMNALGELPYKPDVIVFGEIIEHLQNLETAIINLKSIMTSETELIISTPNQLYVLNFLITLLQQRECVHEDHKIGFTYGLLRQLLSTNDLEIEHFYFTFLPRTSEAWYKKITRKICHFRPGVAETLLAIVKCKHSVV